MNCQLHDKHTLLETISLGSGRTISSPRPSSDGGRRSDPPLHEMFLREPIHIFVGGRDGHHPAHFTREGGEQGDHLMPLLFALGQHRALEAIHERMRPGEHVMAFLDDLYTACRPERLDEVHTTVEEQLATHAHIHVHNGKTQVWNRGGVEPSGIEEMSAETRSYCLAR